jgi:hypothetical protein
MKMKLWSSETRTLGSDRLHGVLVIGLVMFVCWNDQRSRYERPLRGAIIEFVLHKLRNKNISYYMVA